MCCCNLSKSKANRNLDVKEQGMSEEQSKGLSNMETDSRKWARYEIDIPVKIKIPNSMGITTYVYGRGNNVSEGGLAAHVAHELKVGSTIQLVMTLPHSERSIECEVVVRNRESFRYGLEFKGLTVADRDLLMRTCKTLGVLRTL
jgi:hypothetical protein